ncbi:ABC transporter permease [Mycoplasma corogypsi]|uniref:ABC transporter permease n=1 Tax=Mycoplasma corogypsi TaxID=2106 RepID=UPI003873864E
MSNLGNFLKRSYIYLILLLVYVPLAFGFVLSFNPASPKGEVETRLQPGSFTFEHFANLFDAGRDLTFANTVLLAAIVSFFVIVLSLLTSYTLYRQRNKSIKRFVQSSSGIPLINPDNITAIGLVLVFSAFFGILATDSEGFIRLIVAHTVMALPFGISLMLPRSEKFNNNLYEAAQDLGYSSLRAWFKTYFVYMIPSIVMVAVVTSVLSFDDFIITKTVSNTSTLGSKLYEGSFEPWALVLGSIVLVFTIIGNIVYTMVKAKRKVA